MPFIPHTEKDVQSMLADIGVADINALFDEISADVRVDGLPNVPTGMNELEITQHMQARAAANRPLQCFAGAGAYEHHIPAAVWEISTRGEFYSAYTPYQAEASQGTLQLIYEYQSMMTALAQMDVSNASLYDGATALAEAILMAIRCQRKNKSKRIFVPRSVHPAYAEVARSIVTHQGIEIAMLDYDSATGKVILPDGDDSCAAVVIAQPNFFGSLEDVDAITKWAHERDALLIATVNPLSLTLLKPPGQWGDTGADIVCGDGQPLGIPLSAGGPYFGFILCKQAFVRQLPGRIVGRTVDLEGKPGFALTLQAREQHIRRSKATSNICTNQGLMVTAATIHMAIMGYEGLKQAALVSHQNLQQLANLLSDQCGVQAGFSGAHFHEMVIDLQQPAQPIIEKLAAEGILAGYDLSIDYPELQNKLLVCVTETKTADQLNAYADALQAALK